MSKSAEEAISRKTCIARSIGQAVRADRGDRQAREGEAQLEAIARHCDAAIACGGNDRRDDEGHRLAAAFGARLSRRRRAQAPEAEARVEEGGWQSGLPDRKQRRW